MPLTGSECLVCSANAATACLHRRARFLFHSIPTYATDFPPALELVDLITTQRTFELNSQGIQVADQALQLVNNLRRF